MTLVDHDLTWVKVRLRPSGGPYFGGSFLFKVCIEYRSTPTYTETLYHRDNALLYIAYVMLIWAAPIPADRWLCSLWP